MTSSICISGGAGFIGSHLADALGAGGARVVVLDSLVTGSRANVPTGAQLVVEDIRSPAAAELVASGSFDVLVHLAAQKGVAHSVAEPLADASVNVMGSLNLLEAARRGRVRQVVFASTGGAIYGRQERWPADEEQNARPLSPYGVAKLAVERYLDVYHHVHGLDVASLRYANVYGERQDGSGEAGVVAIFLRHLLAGRPPLIHGAGLQTRDYVHVSDVVRANLAVIGRPGRHLYNVGTGIETSVLELYETVAGAVGSKFLPRHGPALPGEPTRSAVDGRRGRLELGLPAPVPLATGIGQTAAWFRRHPGDAAAGGRPASRA